MMALFAPRRFEEADLAAFEAAAQPDGKDSIWMIPVNGGPRRQLAPHINSWKDGRPGQRLPSCDRLTTGQ